MPGGTGAGVGPLERNGQIQRANTRLTTRVLALTSQEDRIAKLEDQVRELSQRLESPGSDSTQVLDSKIADLQADNNGLLTRLTATTDSYRDLETDHQKLQERLDGVIRALDEVIS